MDCELTVEKIQDREKVLNEYRTKKLMKLSAIILVICAVVAVIWIF